MTGIIGEPIPKWSEKRGGGASDVVPFPNTPIYHIVGFSIVLKLFPHMIYWLAYGGSMYLVGPQSPRNQYWIMLSPCEIL